MIKPISITKSQAQRGRPPTTQLQIMDILKQESSIPSSSNLKEETIKSTEQPLSKTEIRNAINYQNCLEGNRTEEIKKRKKSKKCPKCDRHHEQSWFKDISDNVELLCNDGRLRKIQLNNKTGYELTEDGLKYILTTNQLLTSEQFWKIVFRYFKVDSTIERDILDWMQVYFESYHLNIVEEKLLPSHFNILLKLFNDLEYQQNKLFNSTIFTEIIDLIGHDKVGLSLNQLTHKLKSTSNLKFEKYLNKLLVLKIIKPSSKSYKTVYSLTFPGLLFLLYNFTQVNDLSKKSSINKLQKLIDVNHSILPEIFKSSLLQSLGIDLVQTVKILVEIYFHNNLEKLQQSKNYDVYSFLKRMQELRQLRYSNQIHEHCYLGMKFLQTHLDRICPKKKDFKNIRNGYDNHALIALELWGQTHVEFNDFLSNRDLVKLQYFVSKYENLISFIDELSVYVDEISLDLDNESYDDSLQYFINLPDFKLYNSEQRIQKRILFDFYLAYDTLHPEKSKKFFSDNPKISDSFNNEIKSLMGFNQNYSKRMYDICNIKMEMN